MKKLLALLVFGYMAYTLFVKPRRDEEEAAIRMDEIQKHLATLGSYTAKVDYLEKCLAEAGSNQALQDAINALLLSMEAGTSTGLPTGVQTPTGITFELTTQQVATVNAALAVIANDFEYGNNWLRSHHGAIGTYRDVLYNWNDSMVARLIIDWKTAYGSDLYYMAQTQDWSNGFGKNNKWLPGMLAAGNGFTNRVYQVKTKYGL